MTDGLTILLGTLVGLAFVALIVQLGLWLAIYRLGRRMQSRIAESAPGIQSLTTVSRQMIAENRAPAQAPAKHTLAIGRTAWHEASLVARFGVEVRRGLHQEQEHAQVVIEDARHRVHETVELVSRGVAAPFRGVARGIRRAIHFFERRAA